MVTKRSYRLAACLGVLLLANQLPRVGAAAETKTLVAFPAEFDTSKVAAQDARTTVLSTAAGSRLQVATGHAAPWPGITLPAPAAGWDLSAYSEITTAVTNSGPQSVTVHLRVDGPGGDGAKNSITERVTLKPGETRTLRAPLRRKLPVALAEKLFAMRGFPGGYAKDDGLAVSRITQLVVFVDHPTDRTCLSAERHPGGRIARRGSLGHDDTGRVLSDDRRVRAVHPQRLAWQDPLRGGTSRSPRLVS